MTARASFFAWFGVTYEVLATKGSLRNDDEIIQVFILDKTNSSAVNFYLSNHYIVIRLHILPKYKILVIMKYLY